MNRSSLIALAAVASLTLFASGCITNKKWNPAATQPATAGDPAAATPDYWLDQPPTDTVAARDFTTLFDASEDVARGYYFRIDRRDYRKGLLTTQPLVSKQWFEPWRKDVGTGDDLKESSIGPIRRTIFFQFTQNPDGTFTVAPKVLVERYSTVGPEYGAEYAARHEPTRYWYALRRDTVLEQRLADSLRKRLKQEPRERDRTLPATPSSPNSPDRVPRPFET